MIDVFYDEYDHSGIYDAINGTGIEAAWYTFESGVLTPTTRRREIVYQAHPGQPPSLEGVIRLSGLSPDTDEGVVIVYFQQVRVHAKRVKSRYEDFILWPQRAQWGMLVRKFTRGAVTNLQGTSP